MINFKFFMSKVPQFVVPEGFVLHGITTVTFDPESYRPYKTILYRVDGTNDLVHGERIYDGHPMYDYVVIPRPYVIPLNDESDGIRGMDDDPNKEIPYKELVLSMIKYSVKNNMIVSNMIQTIYNDRIINIHYDVDDNSAIIRYQVDNGGSHKNYELWMDAELFLDEING